MTQPFTPPERDRSAFHCPSCGAYAKQEWSAISFMDRLDVSDRFAAEGSAYAEVREWAFSRCTHCGRFGAWLGERLIVPASLSSPPHHEDMPDDVAADYDEAREVMSVSPRAAAALLRLALQRLIPHVLPNCSGNLNDDIGKLVSQGLPVQVQQALDTLRVVGNKAVHPGELDLNDDPETARALFELLNFVVEDRIARPKAISGLFSKLPAGTRNAVQRRDAATEPTNTRNT